MKHKEIHASIDLEIFLTPIDIGPRNSLMMHLNNQMYMYIYTEDFSFWWGGLKPP